MILLERKHAIWSQRVSNYYFCYCLLNIVNCSIFDMEIIAKNQETFWIFIEEAQEQKY